MGMQVSRRISFQQTHDTIWDISYVCFRLILHANLCFVLCCGIRVASMSNVDSIPFLSGVLIFLYSYVNTNPSRLLRLSCQFFSTGVSLFKWIRSFQHPQDHLKVFSTLFVSSVLSCLCFPGLPPFFFKDSYILIKYPFYSCEFSPFLSFNVLTRCFS